MLRPPVEPELLKSLMVLFGWPCEWKIWDGLSEGGIDFWCLSGEAERVKGIGKCLGMEGTGSLGVAVLEVHR
jgi:hypothetical protein